MNLSDVEPLVDECRFRLELVADGQHEIGNLCIVMSQLVEAVDMLRREMERQAEATVRAPLEIPAPTGWWSE